jgi:hypothetical protein
MVSPAGSNPVAYPVATWLPAPSFGARPEKWPPPSVLARKDGLQQGTVDVGLHDRPRWPLSRRQWPRCRTRMAYGLFSSRPRRTPPSASAYSAMSLEAVGGISVLSHTMGHPERILVTCARRLTGTHQDPPRADGWLPTKAAWYDKREATLGRIRPKAGRPNRQKPLNMTKRPSVHPARSPSWRTAGPPRAEQGPAPAQNRGRRPRKTGAAAREKQGPPPAKNRGPRPRGTGGAARAEQKPSPGLISCRGGARRSGTSR